MPGPAILLPTGLVGTTAYPYSITVGGLEVAPTLGELGSIEFTDNADDEPGRLALRYWDADNSRPIRERAIVRVYEAATDDDVFLGVVQRGRYEPVAVGRYVYVEAIGVSSLLDEFLVPLETRPAGESDRARFLYFWGKYAKAPLNGDASQVTQTNASLPADAFLNLTLRSAMRQIAASAGSTVRFYVDALGRPHWYAGAETNPAPYNINVALAPGGGNIAPDELKVERDGVLKNRAYVRGATIEGSGWYQDDASVAAYGPLETYLDAPSSDTAAKAANIARLYFGRVAQPRIRGSFSTEEPYTGWRGGQWTTITDPQNGLAASSQRIVRVTTRFTTGTGKRRYRCEFGAVRAAGSDIADEPLGEAPLPASITSDLLSSGGDAIPASAITVKDALANERVRLGALVGGDYGLRVTSADGATVIIDGTSNMFKIVATGTQTVAFPAAGNGASAETTLSGLGSYATPPQCLYTTADDTSVTLKRGIDADMAVVLASGHMDWRASSYVKLSASPGNVVIVLDVASMLASPGGSASQRYYVLAETAI